MIIPYLYVKFKGDFMQSRLGKPIRYAFTLIELLVVIAIIAILVAL